MDGLSFAAGLLLADLSWNDIEQVPQGFPPTLVSLNLSYNRLDDLSPTLTALAALPKLRILHLKVSRTEMSSILTHASVSAEKFLPLPYLLNIIVHSTKLNLSVSGNPIMQALPHSSLIVHPPYFSKIGQKCHVTGLARQELLHRAALVTITVHHHAGLR